jgi:predicted transcriptional regulator
VWRIDDPYEHPRRAAIAAYVLDNPGATFREVAGSQALAAGTCRHHLNILTRSKVLVERRHGAAVRFFENHGKYDQTWIQVVALREPGLDEVHAFIATHQRVSQKSILNHFEDLGRSRSTTQHRLARLERHGTLTSRFQGRWKFYSILETKAPDQTPAQAGLPEWATRKLCVKEMT